MVTSSLAANVIIRAKPHVLPTWKATCAAHVSAFLDPPGITKPWVMNSLVFYALLTPYNVRLWAHHFGLYPIFYDLGNGSKKLWVLKNNIRLENTCSCCCFLLKIKQLCFKRDSGHLLILNVTQSLSFSRILRLIFNDKRIPMKKIS